jgi:hypothetical protein
MIKYKTSFQYMQAHAMPMDNVVCSRCGCIIDQHYAVGDFQNDEEGDFWRLFCPECFALAIHSMSYADIIYQFPPHQ